MLILAIETSTQICSLALLRDEVLVAEWYVQSGRTHSTGIMQQLSALLERSNIKKNELQAIAVNIGPGSFTGLRIGLSLAKSLAIALDIPLIGISSEQILSAVGSLSNSYVAVLIDAQRNNFYYTLNKWTDGEIVTVSATKITHVSDIKTSLITLGEKVLLAGDYKAELFADLTSVCVLPEHMRLPRAVDLGILAARKLAIGHRDCAYTLGINYIKPSEAEIVWESKHNVQH